MPLASTSSSPLPDLATATVADGVEACVAAAGSDLAFVFALLPALLSLLLPHAPNASINANPEATITFLLIGPVLSAKSNTTTHYVESRREVQVTYGTETRALSPVRWGLPSSGSTVTPILGKRAAFAAEVISTVCAPESGTSNVPAETRLGFASVSPSPTN